MTEHEAIKVLKMVETHGSLTTNAKDMAIKALEEMAKIKELGDCYIIPKNGVWEVNGIDILKALEEVQEYRAIGTVEEFRENKDFLEFLYDRILPNEMEQYLAMYKSLDIKTNGELNYGILLL